MPVGSWPGQKRFARVFVDHQYLLRSLRILLCEIPPSQKWDTHRLKVIRIYLAVADLVCCAGIRVFLHCYYVSESDSSKRKVINCTNGDHSRRKSLGECSNLQTDASLILKAYEAWDTDCAPKIIGHFAFAILDKRKNRLFCVRDAIGVRQLFYYHNGRRLVFASESQQLVADSGYSYKDLNEEYIADFLVTGMPVKDATPSDRSRGFLPGTH